MNHNFPAGYFSFAELTFRLRWRHGLDDADFNQWHATVTFQVKATNNEALLSPSSSYSFYFSQVQLGKFEYFQNALQVCFWKKGWDNKQWGEVKWKGRDWCLLIGKFVGSLWDNDFLLWSILLGQILRISRRRYSLKKFFLKISQISQLNTRVGLQAWNFVKKIL